MSRNSAQNTFQDGLISDLNPILTPNTALTDCLNGTIITYDGNEQSLQNDRGNYPLKNCKLKENYIPVGLKEYNGILYIVSYNPLEDRAEIGSYPSTRLVLESAPDNQLVEISKIDLTKKSEEVEELKYSDLLKECSLKLFIGSNPDKWKVNVGDLYALTEKTEDETENEGYTYRDYQSYEFYIMDDNKKLTDVTDIFSNKIQKISEEGSPEFYHINNIPPGWLGAKLHIASLDDIKVNIEKLPSSAFIPENGKEINLKYRIKVITSDPLFYEKGKNSDLKLNIFIDFGDGPIKQTIPLNSENVREVNYYNGSYAYYIDSNIDGTIKPNSTIKISVIPQLFEMTYPEREFEFSTNRSISKENFKIGDTTWRYFIDGKNLVISANIDGVDSVPLNENLVLKYSITGTDGSAIIKNEGEFYEDIVVEEWNKENTCDIIIPTTAYSADTKQYLVPENLYIVKLELYGNDEIIASCEKLVVASELMYDLKNSRFDTLTLDSWFSEDRFINAIKNKTFKIENWGKVEAQEDIKSEETEGYTTWMSNGVFSDYSTFIETEDQEKLKSGFSISKYIQYTIEGDINSDIEFLHGPLWDPVLEKLKLIYSYNEKQSVLSVDKYTGKLLNPISTTFSSKYGSKITGVYASYSPSNLKLWSYQKIESLDPENIGNINYTLNNVKEDYTVWTTVTTNKDTVRPSTIERGIVPQVVDNLVNYYRDKKAGIVLIKVTLKSDSGVASRNRKTCEVSMFPDIGIKIDNINGGGNKGPKSAYYLAILRKNNNKWSFVFVPIIQSNDESNAESASRQKFKDICQNITHIIGNNDTIEGGFWKVDKVNNGDITSWNIDITSELNTSENIFNDFLKNFTISDTSISVNILTSENPREKIDNIKLYEISEKPSVIINSNSIETEIAGIYNSIENRNKEVESQFSSLRNDPYRQYDADCDIYIDKSGDYTRITTLLNDFRPISSTLNIKTNFPEGNSMFWGGNFLLGNIDSNVSIYI